MKLYIPEVGDCIKLTKDIEFTIKQESRNVVFQESARRLGIVNKEIHRTEKVSGYEYHYKDCIVLIKKGTVLQFDRIYVRKGNSDEYNSITFLVDDKEIGKGRFFVSLSDANKINYEIVKDTKPKKIPRIVKRINCDSVSDFVKDLEPDYSTSVFVDLMAVSELIENEVQNCLRREYFIEKEKSLSKSRDLTKEIAALDEDLSSVWIIDFYLVDGDYIYDIKMDDSSCFVNLMIKFQSLFGDDVITGTGYSTFSFILNQILFKVQGGWHPAISPCGFYSVPEFKYGRLYDALLNNHDCFRVKKEFKEIKKELTARKRQINSLIKNRV